MTDVKIVQELKHKTDVEPVLYQCQNCAKTLINQCQSKQGKKNQKCQNCVLTRLKMLQ